jgi:hypothetical protein
MRGPWNEMSVSVLGLELEVVDLLVFEQGRVGDRWIGSLRVEGWILITGHLQGRPALVSTNQLCLQEIFT